MSNDDYKMGQQGLRYDRTMNRQDYDRGKADAADQSAALGNTRTSVDGGGIGLLFMLPILAIMYPLVTLSQAVMAGGLWLATKWLPPALNWVRVIISIVGLIGAFYFAIKAERTASESKIYRHVRHLFRVIVIGLVTFAFMIDLPHSRNFQAALDHAPPSSLFAALVAVGLMLWLGPKFDRFFFPVRDAYAIKLEKKYAGMSDLEIDETKHRDFWSRARFAGAWLVSTVAVMVAIPHAPVALIALGCFGLCWFLRKTLLRTKPATGGAT